MADTNKFPRAYEDSTPEKIRVMSDETLDAFHRYFVDILPAANRFPNMLLMTKQRIVLLENEIEIQPATSSRSTPVPTPQALETVEPSPEPTATESPSASPQASESK